MNVALVHDWLNGMRGGEKVFEVLCELFPRAPIYTLLFEQGKLSPTIESHPVRTSFVQRLPRAFDIYRRYLPLFPLAVEAFDLREFDLIVSTSHCVAKSARAGRNGFHVCYCHTPIRYVWDMYAEYFGPGRAGRGTRLAMGLLRRPLQVWDARTASRVDHFIANSRAVADRIARHYGRQAEVIAPPVDASRFAPANAPDDYYLIVSALAPYKRIDLAVEAFNRLGRPLRIVGAGPERERLEKTAGPNISFQGWTDGESLARLYAKARAFVFPGLEDFGITPLESMASGRPVIAFGKGGALETVVPLESAKEPTGVFFPEQTAEALCEAVRLFEREERHFDPKALRRHAQAFDRPVFKEKIRRSLLRTVPGLRSLPMP